MLHSAESSLHTLAHIVESQLHALQHGGRVLTKMSLLTRCYATQGEILGVKIVEFIVKLSCHLKNSFAMSKDSTSKPQGMVLCIQNL
jgi:hypothetical protein